MTINASPKKAGELKSYNNRERKLMSNFSCLINASITDADRKSSQITSMSHFLPALELFLKKTDFADEEVE